MQKKNPEQLNELAGYLELGMAKEALALAKQILKQRPLLAEAFTKALQAMLIQADHLKRCRVLIEKGYESLSGQDQEMVSDQMLFFYGSIEDWKKAYAFIPNRSRDPLVLFFSMSTLLELRILDEARPLSKVCCRRLKAVKDEHSTSCLLEALGSYYAQIGDWRRAEVMWQLGSKMTNFAENAWTGLVRIHALRAVLQADSSIKAARNQFFSDGDALMLPGNSATRSNEIIKKLRGYSNHLTRIIPLKERWRFGL